MDLATLFQENVAIGFDRQLGLAEQIGGWSWSLDVEQGLLNLRDGSSSCVRATPVQVLGTESQITRTWLWSWANESQKIADRSLEVAGRLRELGELHGLPELTLPEVALSSIDGAKVALIATGLYGHPGYFRGPYADGAVFMLLEDESFAFPVPRPALRVARTFNKVLNAGGIADHRLALTAYMKHRGIRLDDSSASGLTGTSETGERLIAEFNGSGQLVELNVEPATQK